LFKALSDTTRLRILLLLLERPLCGCELVFILRMEQSRVSHQLRILRDADLVQDVREGRWISYRIHPDAKKKIQWLVTRFLDEETLSSEEIQADRKNLETCIRENIRMKTTLL
ncbi:MAG: ArsR/SmtB family transcription factor, partial [Candidatus Aminicenantales bacterium]